MPTISRLQAYGFSLSGDRLEKPLALHAELVAAEHHGNGDRSFWLQPDMGTIPVRCPETDVACSS